MKEVEGLPERLTDQCADAGSLPALAPVGFVGAMPGTSGFTIAAFKASDVPVGAALYAVAPDAHQEISSLRDHLKAALRHYDMNTCIHENTKRGGTIWTICEDCGRKWADDEGGFVSYADPPEIARARLAISPPPVQGE